MGTAELQVSPIGDLVPFDPPDGTPRANAYRAHDLPATLDLEDTTWRALIKASRSLAQIDVAARRFDNPALLSGPAVWKEALGSSAIEGTVAAFTDVIAAGLSRSMRTPASLEISNYYNTFLAAHEHIAENDLTPNFMCQLQQELLRGAADDSPASGGLRHDYVVIGKRGSDLNEARFIPSPPGDALRDSFHRLIDRINRPGEADALVEIALVHYQFETLHPFHNGNGRLGRMLIGMQLKRFGLLSTPLLSVSTWINDRKTDYLNHLFEVSRTGNFEPWIRFLAEAIDDQSLATVRQIDAVLDHLQDLREQLKHRKFRGKITDVVEGLPSHLAVTAPELSRLYDMTDKHARTVVNQLEQIGAYKALSGSHPKLYVAAKLISIVEGS